MIALALCVFSLVVCFIAGRRSVTAGFIATMVVGYAYGIVRANVPATFSHFIFDAACMGFYLALVTRRYTSVERYKIRAVMPWLAVLIVWPTLLLLVPLQSPLIQLVGWRAQIYFLPFILVGAMLDGIQYRKIAIGFAVLNFIEIAFAVAEVKLGVPRFYPFNEVTQIIYKSTDVTIGNTSTFRIPGTFVQAAVMGAMMVSTIPVLLGALVQQWRSSWRRNLLLAAIGASAICVFLSASRSHAVFLFVLVLAAMVSGRISNLPWYGWLLMVTGVVLLVSSSQRMQRFIQLDDTTYVKTRLSSSINESFIDLAEEYPLGNGLGGGGTSLPYFLAAELRNPVAIENEYGRIMLEQGLPGLAIWLAFIVWTLSRPLPPKGDPWYLGKWLARIAVAFSFLAAQTGSGLMTSIPGAPLLLMFMGWVAAPALIPAAKPAALRPVEKSKPASSAMRTA
ncbi:MAG TPA: hypothetical protein VND20_09355 [Candidatus Binataceae bacterium]|nr:hypothetical protein [Candidatus Binataceae bacterium]